LGGVKGLRALPIAQRVDLLPARAFLQGEGDVGLVFIVRDVDDRYAQDSELAIAPRQLALLAHRGEKRQPAVCDRRAVEQHAIQVGHLAALLADPLGKRLDFVVAVFVGVGYPRHGVRLLEWCRAYDNVTPAVGDCVDVILNGRAGRGLPSQGRNMRAVRSGLAVLLAISVCGCVTYPRQALDKKSMSGVKRIAILQVSENPAEYRINMLKHPAGLFGALGGLALASE